MLTKLDAVNRLLGAIGENPVNTLNSGNNDAEAAQVKLDAVRLDVLNVGWHCNTDNEYTLVRNIDQMIPVSTTILRIDSSGKDNWRDVVVRTYEQDGRRYLYDRENQTFVFDRDVVCDIVWDFGYEDLTYALQEYIAARAAKEYQQEELGAQSVDQRIKERELAAYATLLDEEAENQDLNIFRQSPAANWIARRFSDIP